MARSNTQISATVSESGEASNKAQPRPGASGDAQGVPDSNLPKRTRRRGTPLTAGEIAVLVEECMDMLVKPGGEALVRKHLRTKHDWSARRCSLAIKRFWGYLERSNAREAEHAKLTAVRRIQRALDGAMAARKWSAVAQLEAQLARIQGTEAPVKHAHSHVHEIGEGIATLLASLTPEAIEGFALQYEQLEAQAKALPPARVDISVTEVHASSEAIDAVHDEQKPHRDPVR